MNQQDLKECIAEVKNSDIPNPSKRKIMNILYEWMHKDGWIPCSCNISGQMTIEEYLQTLSE